MTNELKWADGAAVRTEAEAQIAALLGPRTAEDDKPLEKKKKAKSADDAPAKKAGKKGGAVKTAASAGVGALADEGHDFPPPAANAAGNKPHILKAHLEATGGKVMTRFPPEPNGYLHIGHAKAQFLDFGYAKKLGGEVILIFVILFLSFLFLLFFFCKKKLFIVHLLLLLLLVVVGCCWLLLVVVGGCWWLLVVVGGC